MAHWSERTGCVCGRSFRVGSAAEARHRHNFPALCDRRGLAHWRAAQERSRASEPAPPAAAAAPPASRGSRPGPRPPSDGGGS